MTAVLAVCSEGGLECLHWEHNNNITILKTFQPVLFKAYDASLRDITQKCGFKAITPTSLPIGELHTVSLCRLVKQYQCMLSAFVHHHNEISLHSFPSNNFFSVHIEAVTAVQLEECHKYSIPSHVEGYSLPLQTYHFMDFKSLEDR